MDGDQILSNLFEDSECDILSILEALEGEGSANSELNNNNSNNNNQSITMTTSEEGKKRKLVSQKSTGSSATSGQELYCEEADTPSSKRQNSTATAGVENRISHITVERNRRKQMNEHLSVLRTLMPCFYAKRVRLFFFLFSLYSHFRK